MVWQERRSNVRHAVELPIRYRILTEAKPLIKTSPSAVPSNKTRNISDTGLLFLSSERFRVGVLLELTLPVKDKLFTIEGRVVHASQDSDSGLFRTGIHFPKLDSVFKVKMAEQVHQIEQYRKTLSQEEGRVVLEEEAAHRWIDEHSDRFAKFFKI